MSKFPLFRNDFVVYVRERVYGPVFLSYSIVPFAVIHRLKEKVPRVKGMAIIHLRTSS